jgi:lactate racemase
VKVKLAYGRTGLEVALPDHPHLQILEPRYVPGIEDQAGAVRRALRQPIGAPPLSKIAKAADRVGIVCNDGTRATPYAVILPALLKELENVDPRRITFFIAAGTHRAATPDELKRLLGEEIAADYRVVQNNAFAESDHELAGVTDSGNAIRLHREVMNCDLRILTGFIEPHFFAGFSGGPKALAPGMAHAETILYNHRPENIDDPHARWGITAGNPLWEELRQGAAFAGPSFLLNVALNRDKQIIGAFAGEVDRAHREGCAFVRDRCMAATEEPADIVLTTNSGYPLDQNLYQAVKGLAAAEEIVRSGGTIIMAAECSEGVPDGSPYHRLLAGASDLAELLQTIRNHRPTLCEGWQVQIHARICLKAKVHFYSDGLSEERIREAFFQPCRDLEGLLTRLLREKPDARLAVLPEGPQTIPYLASK